jgi:CubicO group peptidase (beta-lactamase class C family)
MNLGRVFASLLAVSIWGCAGEPAPAPVSPAPPAPPPGPAQPAPVAAVFAERGPQYAFPDPDRSKKLATAFGAIDALAESTLKSQNIPGLAVGVIVDGVLVHERGFGVVDLEGKKAPDADTVFRIGSLTKSFTALSLLALRDDGKLSLDDTLARWIPEAGQLVYPTRDSRPIVLRQILTHTSGLPRLGSFNYTRADAAPSEREVVDSLKGFALENPPSSAFVYSNLGFALLGLVVGHASGMPYRAFVTSRVLKPLGMTSSGFDESEIPKDHFATGYRRGPGGRRVVASPWRLGASEGAGGIYSTVRDMSRYLAFELAAYPPRSDDDAGSVKRATVRELHASALAAGLHVSERTSPAKGEHTVNAVASGLGFGWGVATTCDFTLVAHDGAIDGFASRVTFVPDRGVGVVVLANFVDAELGDLADGAIRELQKTGGLVARQKVTAPDPLVDAAMKRFLAVYNAWDLGAYQAMLSKNRPPVAPKAEEDELAGYKSIHGACRGYKPIEFTSPLRGKVAMECEKGTLEMSITLDATDHLIAGFDGTSKGVPMPERLLPAAKGVVSLIAKWDDRLYAKHLAPRSPGKKEDTVAFYAKVRERHGTCKLGSAERTGDGSFTTLLTCDRGGDVRLHLKVDEKTPDVIVEYTIKPASPPGVCPVR